jgi:WD40 repeat protein
VEDLPSALRSALEAHESQQFVVVVDALDETVSPEDARSVITQIIVPVAETCSDVGVRILVGSRSRDNDGDLLEAFGLAAEIVDLDDASYFDEADLSAYARATLLLLGAERPGNPYTNPDVAGAVADRIAELSDRNFLVAGLVARTHGLYDKFAVRPETISFTPTVSAALKEYLRRLPPVGGIEAHQALAALAYAEAPGFTIDLWVTAIAAIYGVDLPALQLKNFSLSSAANFLIETSSLGDSNQYRLFHQALNDSLIAGRDTSHSSVLDERAIARALIAVGRSTTWKRANDYLLRSLPGHAQRGSILDELLIDDDYLLHADLRRLIPIADQEASDKTRSRAQLIRKTPQAINANPGTRIALFSVTELQESLGECYAKSIDPAPYRAQWSTVAPRTEEVTLEGSWGTVEALAPLQVDGRHLLASGSVAGVIRISDPSSGETLRTLEGHTGHIVALCDLRMGKRTLLVSASSEKEVFVWDPDAGRIQYRLEGIEVQSVCGISSGDPLEPDSSWVAIVTAEGRVVVWRPTDGEVYGVVEDLEWVEAISSLVYGGQDFLLCATQGYAIIVDPAAPGTHRVISEELPSDGISSITRTQASGINAFACAVVDGAVNIYDVDSGSLIREMAAAPESVRDLCWVQGSQDYLLAAYHGSTISVWDPRSGHLLRSLTGHTGNILSMCPVRVGARAMLATGGADSSVRIWDPEAARTGQKLGDLRKATVGVTPVTLNQRPALLTGSQNGIVRIYSPGSGKVLRNLGTFGKRLSSVSSARIAGRLMSLIGNQDGIVYVVDSETKEPYRKVRTHEAPVSSIHPFKFGDWSLVASGDINGRICVWDPITGDAVCEIDDRFDAIYGISSVGRGAETVLVGSGWSPNNNICQSISLFDPISGALLDELIGHMGQVFSVKEVSLGEKSALVSCSDDWTAIVWDVQSRFPLVTLEGHRDWVWSACEIRLGNWSAIATGGDDRTVRLWECGTWRFLIEIPVYHPVAALTQVGSQLVVGSDAGLLAMSINPAWLNATGD